MPTTDPLMTGATPADRPPIVALIGLGALGAAHVATMINHDPATVVRVIAGGERGERLRQQGMTANDRTYDLTVVAPGEDSQPPADLVLLAVKAYDLEPAIADIAGQVGPDTVIVSLLNGVASERAVQEAYPDNFVPLAYSILSNAGRDDTGFRFYAVGQIHLGEPTNDPPSAR
ncbi:MAG: NAD(P)-binding domain-containing protein, partial [Propionibacteriaceae bacterium]|nr:NAD(P)-binding domain-containing protein [Propionibacteriaceae bacterium]